MRRAPVVEERVYGFWTSLRIFPSEFQPGETADIIHIVPCWLIQRIIVLETNLNPGAFGRLLASMDSLGLLAAYKYLQHYEDEAN